MARKEGQFLVEDFFLNAGGLNTADSPFLVEATQCTGGQNFDYIRRGGLQKRAGHTKLNSVADTQLKTIGLGLWDKPGSVREVIRSAGQKIQNYDPNAVTFTDMTEDTTAAGSNFWSGGTEVPVVSTMFNTATSGILWMAGGGASSLYGAYSDTKITQNGVEATSGTSSGSAAATGGSFPSTGVYRYAFSLYKAATGAEGNAGTECAVTISATTDTVTLDLSSLGAIDTAKYTKLYIYRSAVGGAVGFTTGDLVKELDISAGVPASTTDTGTSLESSVTVPRAGSAVLDNSPLSVTDPRSLALFQRRLVTASRSTVYLSDVNKSESWPTLNQITIPSGGDITGLAVISRNTSASSSSEEILCVFKQRELWIITGDDLTTWRLKFIDNSGCPNQPLIVQANGYLAWFTHRGGYLWDGSAKPVYLTQPIEDKFQRGGDIDKSKITQGFGVFAQGRNEIQWYLSSGTEGTQKVCFKLDLRLTLNQAATGLNERQVKGVFTPDVTGFSVYAGLSYLSSSTASEESFVLGDNTGFLYSAYSATSEAGASYDMEYVTPFLDLGSVGSAKRVSKVVLWVLDSGSFDINLDFWSGYRYTDADASSQSLRVSANLEGASLVWGVGEWGENYWGTSSQKIKSLVYNLSSSKNNTEGDAFRFRISQSGSTDTVVIYGFSVYYTELTLRK